MSALETRINTNDVYTQSFVWDDLGNLKQQGYPSCGHCPLSAGVPSRTVSYTYAEGFLTAVPGWASSITYHPSGMVSQITHANTVVSTWVESPHKMARPASLTVTKGTSTLFSSGAYQYDGSGNVVAIGSDYYLYDRFGRLSEGTVFKAGSSRKQTYGYDGFNNLTAITTWTNGIASARTLSVSTTSNRLTGAAYDGAGNQTSWGTQGYSWNPESRMYRYAAGGGTFYHAFSTDGERAMTYHAETGRSTFRIRGLDGKVVREVSHLQGAANPWKWEKDWIHRDGQLLATVTPAEGTRYAHADHLGSPRIVTDSAGTVRGTYHYFPFGEQAGTAPTTPEALRFTGHERDGGASASAVADDLDYMHQRFYHPQLGRFLSFDPVGGVGRVPGSWNRYAYVLGNPMRYIDPEGLQAATFYDSITVVDGGCADCYFTRGFGEMLIQFNYSHLAAVKGWLQDLRVATLQKGVYGEISMFEGSLLTGIATLGDQLLPTSDLELGVLLGGALLPIGRLGDEAVDGLRLVGRNPRVTKTQINTDLPGGKATAKSIFRHFSKGKNVVEQPMGNGGLRRTTDDGSVQIRFNPDGSVRIDLTVMGFREVIHFN